MSLTHVFNVSPSSHTASGISILDATDNSAPLKYPDFRPIATEFRGAETGRLLFKKTSGIDRETVWEDGDGRILSDHEQPDIYTVQQFYDMFGGAEFCSIK
jgi:hypothetical protein